MEVLNKARTLLARMWSAAPVATVVLLIALSASVVFGVRSAIFWHQRPPWDARVQSVEPWMTPGFIIRAWRLPRREFLAAIQAPMPPPDGPMSLTELATYRGVPVAQIIAEAEAFIARNRPTPEEARGK